MLGSATRRINTILQRLGSLLPSRDVAPPDRGRVVQPWRDDLHLRYPSRGLTPTRAAALLQAADAGTPQDQFELFGEMLQKWPRLAAVEQTRRLALTGLGWEIQPADVRGDDRQRVGLALAAAEHANEVLSAVRGLRATLDHLARAIGYGASVAEIVWERGRPVELVPAPHTRLFGRSDEPWRLRLRTESAPTDGVALDEQPNKWIVHVPQVAPGRPFEGGLLRASVLLYLAQNLSFKDWLTWSQLAGMPVRVAQFEPGTPDADKTALLRMLSELGTEAAAVFSKNIDLKFIDTHGSGEAPYQPLQDYCNTEITILWLGQHLTTDVRSSGSRAAAEIHDRVREDLLVDDMNDEAETLRRDLLTPIVRARFGDDVPIPRFERSLVQAADTKVLAETLAVAVRDLRLGVPARWAHRALGIPEPIDGERVLRVDEVRP